MNLYQNFTAKLYSFLVMDTTLNTAKISVLLSSKMINMNILQVKKYYHLIKIEQQNKLRLPILL